MDEKNKMEIVKKEKEDFLIGQSELSDVELGRLICEVEESKMLTAPKRLKDNILRESKTVIVLAEVQKNKLSNKVQLLFYGMKIFAAVTGALLLLTVVNVDSAFIQPPQDITLLSGKEISKTLKEKANVVSSALNQFSQTIILGKE